MEVYQNGGTLPNHPFLDGGFSLINQALFMETPMVSGLPPAPGEFVLAAVRFQPSVLNMIEPEWLNDRRCRPEPRLNGSWSSGIAQYLSQVTYFFF